MEHVDVLVVGAGLSGVGAAARLELERPGTSYAVLEARGTIGGTWDLFRYPGVRSDSDMHTLGYPFRPWVEGARDRRRAVDPRATSATPRASSASSRRCACTTGWWPPTGRATEARWTVQVERADTGEQFAMTCSFLYSCTGYYRYDHGYEPEFAGPRALRRHRWCTRSTGPPTST